MNVPITEQLIDAAMLFGGEKDTIRIGERDGLAYCRFVVKGRRRTFWSADAKRLVDRMRDRGYAPLETAGA